MSKTRTPFNKEQNKQYWAKRITEKTTSIVNQNRHDVKDLTDMAVHIGLKEKYVKILTMKFDVVLKEFVEEVEATTGEK